MKKYKYAKVYLKDADIYILSQIKHTTEDTLSDIFKKALVYYYENVTLKTKGNKK